MKRNLIYLCLIVSLTLSNAFATLHVITLIGGLKFAVLEKDDRAKNIYSIYKNALLLDPDVQMQFIFADEEDMHVIFSQLMYYNNKLKVELKKIFESTPEGAAAVAPLPVLKAVKRPLYELLKDINEDDISSIVKLSTLATALSPLQDQLYTHLENIKTEDKLAINVIAHGGPDYSGIGRGAEMVGWSKASAETSASVIKWRDLQEMFRPLLQRSSFSAIMTNSCFGGGLHHFARCGEERLVTFSSIAPSEESKLPNVSLPTYLSTFWQALPRSHSLWQAHSMAAFSEIPTNYASDSYFDFIDAYFSTGPYHPDHLNFSLRGIIDPDKMFTSDFNVKSVSDLVLAKEDDVSLLLDTRVNISFSNEILKLFSLTNSQVRSLLEAYTSPPVKSSSDVAECATTSPETSLDLTKAFNDHIIDIVTSDQEFLAHEVASLGLEACVAVIPSPLVCESLLSKVQPIEEKQYILAKVKSEMQVLLDRNYATLRSFELMLKSLLDSGIAKDNPIFKEALNSYRRKMAENYSNLLNFHRDYVQLHIHIEHFKKALAFHRAALPAVVAKALRIIETESQSLRSISSGK